MSKPGRNDPCPCGSGRKYKQCCLAPRAAPASAPGRPAAPPVAAVFKAACAHHEAGRLDQAAALYRQVLAREPAHADALHLLALVLRSQGQPAPALELLRRAVALAPANPVFHCNLGIVLKDLGRRDEAIAAYRQAIAVGARFFGAHYNLGVALHELGRPAEALASLERAVALAPGYAQAHNQLGIVELALGRTDAAAASLRRALACDPGFAMAHSNLLSVMQYQPGVGRDEAMAELRRFAARFEAPWRPRWPAHDNDRDPQRRLRVGYVSADFRHHSVAYFIEPVLAHHDKARVEVFCYYNHGWRDAVTARLAGHADHWRDCRGLADDALAQKIRADGIDILVDLAGHTADNRLPVFARKPAPVQVTYLGYPGSTGLAAIDYRLTDADLDPPGMTEDLHSEILVRLTNYAPFQPAADSPPVGPLPVLASGRVTFACLNNPAKLNPAVAALWARILAALPEARLILGNAGDELAREDFRRLFAAAGVAPERLVLLPPMPLADYLALHGQIDLALDPFPWNGGTTSQHTLWMGVPVITLAGDRTAGRLGVTTLRHAGLPEFVAEDADAYVAIALRWARDLPALDALRQGLRARIAGHPENDPARITGEIEAAYRDMWRRWCAAGTTS